MEVNDQVKAERRLRRNKIVRISIWVIGALIILSLIPAVVATVWIPSCTTCHDKASFTTATHKSAHADVECTTCHGGESGKDALKYRETVMYQMVIPIFKSSPNQLANVPNSTCSSCHEEVGEKTTTSNGIRINHAECAETRTCLDCHSTVAHGVAELWPRQYDMQDCLRCHAKASVGTDKGCGFCHVGDHDSPAPTAGTSFKSTHGKDWKNTHGMGDMTTCNACHPKDYCTPCHGEGVPHDDRILSTHGNFAKSANSKCESCHQDERFCDNCHGMPMPHPANFLKDHSKITAELGKDSCMNCHVESDCDTCHAAHIHPGGAL